MNKLQYFLKFSEMQFYWLLHFITIPFVKLHEFATDKNNAIDDLLYNDPITMQLVRKKEDKIRKRAEKEAKKNGNIGSI